MRVDSFLPRVSDIFDAQYIASNVVCSPKAPP